MLLNLVEEVEDPLSSNVQESGKNDTENVLDPLDVSPKRITTITDNACISDAQSDPEYELKDEDNDDEDSLSEADDDLHDLDFTSQSPRNKEKPSRSPVKTYRKSTSSGSEPKNSTRRNPRKASRTHGDDAENSSSAHPVSCPICHKQFKGRSAKSTLNRHLDIHAPEPKFPCPHCPAKFKQEKGRQDHIQRVHLNLKPEKKLACEFCDKKFAFPTEKKTHEMVRCHVSLGFRIYS
jgi:uncharacterized Zn-finger protein